MTYRLRIEFETELDPRFFFDDADVNAHEDATEVDCARQVADYVHRRGLSFFLSDWNVDDLDIHVGMYPAVLAGRPVVGEAVSNTDRERP